MLTTEVLLAERNGASGVLATLAAGLLVGNYGWKRAILEHGQGLRAVVLGVSVLPGELGDSC